MKKQPGQRCVNCRCSLWLALAVVAALTAVEGKGQGIICGQFPVTPAGPPGTAVFPEDSQGWRLFGDDTSVASYNWVINGNATFTFTAGGGVSIYPASSLNGVIGVAVDQFGGNLAVPLGAGQEIGPGAAGYNWFTDPAFGSLLAVTYDGGAGGPLHEGYFTGVESACLGLEFQQDDQTYYGWLRVGTPYTGLDALWLYDYAYQTTPNTPILAGEVPEPTALMLFALGGLVAAIAGRRTKVTRLPRNPGPSRPG